MYSLQFARVILTQSDHLLDGSGATRQWLSDIHDVWPDGLSEQWSVCPSTLAVRVVDPSIDQRVVIRGGRPTLQPLTEAHLNSGGSGGQPNG